MSFRVVQITYKPCLSPKKAQLVTVIELTRYKVGPVKRTVPFEWKYENNFCESSAETMICFFLIIQNFAPDNLYLIDLLNVLSIEVVSK